MGIYSGGNESDFVADATCRLFLHSQVCSSCASFIHVNYMGRHMCVLALDWLRGSLNILSPHLDTGSPQ